MPRYNDEKQVEKPNDKKEIDSFIEEVKKFVQNKSCSLDSGYAVVAKKDIDEMYDLIERMVELRFELDSDGDYPIDFKLIDRTRFQSSNYRLIPHPEDFDNETLEEQWKIAKIAKINLENAQEQFNREWRMLEYLKKEQNND
jgi:flagellar biosynthesis component FlhA